MPHKIACTAPLQAAEQSKDALAAADVRWEARCAQLQLRILDLESSYVHQSLYAGALHRLQESEALRAAAEGPSKYTHFSSVMCTDACVCLVI